jgi:tRNA 2-selenouridine synthase
MMEKALPETSDYLGMVLQARPMIDVRAPIEFARGALPMAMNLPLMNDDERHQVGLRYRQQGQQKAIALGHKLVSDDVKRQRLDAWLDFVQANPNTVIYCARGGLRSQLTQQWMADAGVTCPRVRGGYKHLRAFLLKTLDDFCLQPSIIILSGMTGTGKTQIIKGLENSIDLEGAANHKGSSFGRPIGQQPAQIDFENQIIIDLIRITNQQSPAALVLEDESRNIGGRHLPKPLTGAMARSPMAVIELPFEQRIENLWREYVLDRYQQTLAFYGDRADAEFCNYLIDSLMRIQKRLGGDRTKKIKSLMQEALNSQHNDGFAHHREWLKVITADYYDPMYLYQLEQRIDRVVFRGDEKAVLDWLSQNS